MKSSARKALSLMLGLLMSFSVVGCGGGGGGEKGDATSTPETSTPGGEVITPGKYDTETRPVVFATDALDGNFNPFFATSATDSEITAITQIGMLTTDAKGNLVCGEDQPTVALDYRTTMKDADGNETTNAYTLSAKCCTGYIH